MSRLSWCLGLSLLSAATLSATDWPQWLGPKRDGVWREKGLVDKFPEKGLPVRWRTPLGKGYAGPAVAEGKVFVMDWNREKDKDGNNVRPTKEGIPGKERLLCLDEKTGKTLWEYNYDAKYKMSYPNGPRVTPVVENGKVYAIGGPSVSVSATPPLTSLTQPRRSHARSCLLVLSREAPMICAISL